MSLEITEILDLKNLAESEEVEFKQAAGRDGKGTLPQDFWASYSAMANTRGGWVILGIKEKKGHFSIEGVSEPEKIRTDLFNQLNDRDKVSVNLLKGTEDVLFIQLENKTIIAIRVPPASRKQKPVYITKSPFGNTYIRQDDGDRRCDDLAVKRMLAEQLYESRDNQILSSHFSFNQDINHDSLRTYRNLLSAHNPQHPYLELDLPAFFRTIGGWRKDRETGDEGITLAGLLMFGEWEAINDALPNYLVDYQERPAAKTELRWIDRVVPDGTWSGNLFDFYRKVFQKLTSDLKIPFVLENGQRKGDTPIHTALREALVNTLVHADYSENVSLLVVKRPDLYGFRNPGTPRLPIEDVLSGGISDCRNRLLHQMFLLVGLGERAGSGMPKIFSGWKQANWRTPKLWEKLSPAQTILELSTASLIPDDAIQILQLYFGENVQSLDELELLIVTTALVEGWVNHERACQLTSKHSRDVTLALPRLVNRGFLTSSGENRQKVYTLPGVVLATPDQVFAGVQLLSDERNESSAYNEQDSTYSESSSTYSGSSSTYSQDSKDAQRDKYGRLLSKHFDSPYIDSIQALSQEFQKQLFDLAKESRLKKRLSTEAMIEIILAVCSEHYVSASALGTILNRNSNSIRQQYLASLIEAGRLKLAVPQYKNDPRQGYMGTEIHQKK